MRLPPCELYESSFRYDGGGGLQADAPNDVVCQTDRDLQAALQACEFDYVFSSRHMGQSLLLILMKQQLQVTGVACAYLGMTGLGTMGLTPDPLVCGCRDGLAANAHHDVNQPLLAKERCRRWSGFSHHVELRDWRAKKIPMD